MARVPKNAPTKRLNLEMPEEVRAKLERLRDDTNAYSLAEVIGRALAVYDFLWREKTDGATLMVKKGKAEKEVVLL